MEDAVGQLYEDESLTLRALDLIFFKTDLNNSLLKLIYFLNIPTMAHDGSFNIYEKNIFHAQLNEDKLYNLEARSCQHLPFPMRKYVSFRLHNPFFRSSVTVVVEKYQTITSAHSAL